MTVHTQETIEDVRTNVEEEKLKTLKEFTRITQKLNNLNYVVEMLPNQVKQCEIMCQNSSDTTFKMKEEMGKV